MKKFLSFILFISFQLLFAQSTKGRWQDLFSYNNVKFIEEIDGELYCGTENGIFVYHPNQDEFLKLNKTNVLNQVGISAMAYSPTSKILVIGYENGSIDLYDLESKTTKIVLDIPWNNFSGNKKINDILINGETAFISGSFGIVSFDLKDNQFKETTFTNSIIVNDATILNQTLYIATSNGVYSCILNNEGLNNPNFYDRQIWKEIKTLYNDDLNFQEANRIVNFNGKIYYTINTIKYRYEIDEIDEKFKVEDSRENDLFEYETLIKSTPYFINIDLKTTNNKLLITQINSLKYLGGDEISINYTEKNNNITQQKQVNFNTGIYYNDNLYAGSTDFGLLNLDNHKTDENRLPEGFFPDGPFNNQSFSVTSTNKKVWIAPGGITNYDAPQSNSNGFYFFDQFKWIHFKSNDLLNAKDFIKIAVNPNDSNHFIAIPYFESIDWSYYPTKDEAQACLNDQNKRGFFEFNLNKNQNEGNHIVNDFKWLTRIGGGNFDQNGDLYLSSSFPCINGKINSSANYYYQRKGNNWNTSQISIKNKSSTTLTPTISSKYVWYPNARSGGLSVLDKNMNEIVTLTKANADLYDDSVTSVAIDNNNSIWIGTALGITVLNGGDTSIANGNYKTEPIVIIQNGIPEALLTSIGINAIKVDKANRKWIATNSSGVFYVSSNGEQTIQHFTAKNSPLPSDIVYDIDIDHSTGKVYFATEKGVVAFNGDVQDIGDNFNQAIVYPNPVRPGYKGNVTIKNLPERASVKITDIVGNLLFEAKASGGIVEWDAKNNKGKYVASGVYLVLMTNTDGTETKTLKIAVVR